MDNFFSQIEFEWDVGNIRKNFERHDLDTRRIEEAFLGFNIMMPDEKHSTTEVRNLLIGRDNLNNKLSVIFTIRYGKVRVISARGANKLERELYEKAFKKYSQIQK